MAIGLGKMFGFEFLENFNYPYISRSVTEFGDVGIFSWVPGSGNTYIPWAGNRVPIPRLFLNLAVVWLLTGLWHGASWNFAYSGRLLWVDPFC